MPSHFNRLMKQQRRTYQKLDQQNPMRRLAAVMSQMYCPACGESPRRIRLESNVLICPSCELHIVALPDVAPNEPGFAEAYQQAAQQEVTIEAVANWFAPRNLIMAGQFLGWLYPILVAESKNGATA